jgi:hypothetical protein
MRPHNPALVVLVVASFFAAGCVEQKVRALAAPDLRCPEARIDVVGSAGSYVARGCGKWVEYTCIGERSGLTCFPRPHADVHDDTATRE